MQIYNFDAQKTSKYNIIMALHSSKYIIRYIRFWNIILQYVNFKQKHWVSYSRYC